MKDAILAIDTSGPRAFVSIGNGTKVCSRSADSSDSHNEELAELVHGVLKEFGTSASTLGRVLLGIGPGSFTGLRIGLAFAKGLCQSLSIPLSTISSLKLIASTIGRSEQSEISGALFDARRGEFFSALYTQRTMQVLLSPSIRTFEEFERSAAPFLESALGSLSVGSWIAALPESAIQFVQPHSVGEEAIRLFLENQEHFDSINWDPISLSAIEPEYLRSVSAKSIAERQAIKGS